METGRYTKLRTTIIVVSMLVLPAAAVFGLRLPGSSTSAKQDQEHAASPKTAERKGRSGSQQLASAAEAKTRTSFGAEQAMSTTGGSLLPVSGFAGVSSSSFPVRHAANIDVQNPADSATSELGVIQAGAAQAGLPAAATLAELGAVSAPTPGSFAPPPATETPLATNPSAPLSAPNPEQFSVIQTRLRALGATYYALETWGTSGQLYRFQCRMAAGHSASYTRQFEATDTDALAAMQTVLEEVEAWKAGRLP